MHTLHRASHTRGSFLFSKRKDDFSMQLVIAEKASVGFALAKALGVYCCPYLSACQGHGG